MGGLQGPPSRRAMAAGAKQLHGRTFSMQLECTCALNGILGGPCVLARCLGHHVGRISFVATKASGSRCDHSIQFRKGVDSLCHLYPVPALSPRLSIDEGERQDHRLHLATKISNYCRYYYYYLFFPSRHLPFISLKRRTQLKYLSLNFSHNLPSVLGSEGGEVKRVILLLFVSFSKREQAEPKS